jgi:GNAT superfamily N-acetyltransferase
MDLLVKLYELPSGIEEGSVKYKVRRALVCDRSAVAQWVRDTFKNEGWGCEVEACFSRNPVSCWISSQNGNVTGFACYDSVAKGVFGPMGVDPSLQGKGLGKQLLLAVLETMRHQGYAYAVIGWTGPVAFYQKAVGAIVIPDSEPARGMYRGLLAHD